MKIKRNKVDILFSKLIRERADWACECCKRDFRDNPGGLHCSHIFSRRHILTRHCKENAVAHCIGCHRVLGENPIEFATWAKINKGQQVIAKVERLKNEIRKLTKQDKEDIYRFLKEQYNQMMIKRNQGAIGYIDYDCPQYKPELIAKFLEKENAKHG